MNAARTLDARSLRGDPTEHSLGANYPGDRFLVAEAVLEADRHRVAVEQAGGAGSAHRRLGAGRLAVHQHYIHRPARRGIDGGRHADTAFAAMAHDAQSVAIDRVDMLPPDIDQGHLETVFGKLAAEQTAHGAGAKDSDFRFHSPSCRRRLRPSRARSFQP